MRIFSTSILLIFYFLLAFPVAAEIVVFSSAQTRCRPVSLNENINLSMSGATGRGCEFTIMAQAQGEWALAGGYYDTPPYGWGGAYPFLIDERSGYVDPDGSNEPHNSRYRNYSFTCSQPSYNVSNLPSYISVVKSEDISGSVPSLANAKRYTFRVDANAPTGSSFTIQTGFAATCSMESEDGLSPVTYTQRCQDQSPTSINPRRATGSYTVSVSSSSCITPTASPRPTSTKTPTPRPTNTVIPPNPSCGICGINPTEGLAIISTCMFDTSSSSCSTADINGDGKIDAGDMTMCGMCAPSAPPSPTNTPTPFPPVPCGEMCNDAVSCMPGNACVRLGSGYDGTCALMNATTIQRCAINMIYENCCIMPTPTNTPTPTFTPMPTATPMPTPTPKEWYKLSKSSFHRKGYLDIQIPRNISTYDKDDTTEEYLSINRAGVVTVKSSFLSIDSATSKVSANNWSVTSFQDDDSMLSNLGQYIGNRKKQGIINKITEIDDISSDMINIIERDVVINSTNSISPSLNNIVLFVSGNVTFADMPGNNDKFNTAGKSIAIISSGTMNVHSDYAELHGIFIAQNMNLAYNVLSSSPKSANPLKIDGNLISVSPLTDLRRARTDYTKPTLFIVLNPKMYMDLLPYLGVTMRESGNIQ